MTDQAPQAQPPQLEPEGPSEAASQRPVVRHRGTVPQGRPRTPAEEAGAAAPSLTQPKRRVYTTTYTIPEDVRDAERDPMTITLRELTGTEMIEAVKLGRAIGRGGEDQTVLMSIFEVDGARVNHAEEEATAYWARWSAKTRILVQAAWGRIHTTTKAEDAAFFDSARPGVVVL